MSHIENAFALVVGIAAYQHIRPLPDTVIADARAIHAALADEQLCAYPPQNATLLCDAAASGQAIRQALDDLADRASDDATVFIYVSSHGGRIDDGPHAGEYLLPVDVQFASPESLAATSISGAELTAALRKIPARKLVIAFDCCHAGGIGEPKDATWTPLPERYYDTLKGGRGRVILASSRSTELSWILPGAGHSLFTQHLIDGLAGGANGAGGVIRIFDLFDYVQPRVTADQPDQHPIFKAEIEENFPVALYRGGAKEAAPAPAPTADSYDFDVFVTHSGDKTDRGWVRSSLVPLLDQQGLKVAIDYRAPLGVPKIVFSEEAVQKSRYTVVVLSPAYVASGYAEFESLLGQHLGLEESAYRVIPLMIEECTPRLGLRILPILDMTDAEETEINMDRLLDYLGQRPQPPRG